jgi:hypothetical protein
MRPADADMIKGHLEIIFEVPRGNVECMVDPPSDKGCHQQHVHAFICYWPHAGLTLSQVHKVESIIGASEIAFSWVFELGQVQLHMRCWRDV